MRRLAVLAASCAACFAAGRLTAPEPESRTVVDTLSEVRTVYVTRTAEARRETSSKARTVVRRVVEPCDCRARRMVLDERVAEASEDSASSLRLDVSSLGAGSVQSSRRESAASGKAWSVDVMTGLDTDLKLTVGAHSSRQVGGISVGVWGLYAPDPGRFTGGVSAGIRF